MRRITLLLTAAITGLMMTAGPVLAAPPPKEEKPPKDTGSFSKQCTDSGGIASDFQGTFTCTTTTPFEDRQTRAAGNSGRQFDVTGTDTTTTSQQGNSPNRAPEDQTVTNTTTVTSCENPGEREINPDNPNCQLTGVPGQG